MIRKVLGYALTDLVENDPRINWESPLLSESMATPSFEDFATHLEAINATGSSGFDTYGIRQHAKKRPGYALDRCVVHASDGSPGLPEVLVIVPPSLANEWIRSDDIFDYTEAVAPEEPAYAPTVIYPRGIHPFDGEWMDKKTGEWLDSHRVSRFLQQVDRRDSPEKITYGVQKIRVFRPWDDDFVPPAEPLFKDSREAFSRLVRLVPAEVREFADYGDLFTDSETWKTLHPVLYTYWT